MSGTGGCEHFTLIDTDTDVTGIGKMLEGICASCDIALERDGEMGRCPCCGVGVSVKPDGVLVHFPIDVASVLRQQQTA